MNFQAYRYPCWHARPQGWSKRSMLSFRSSIWRPNSSSNSYWWRELRLVAHKAERFGGEGPTEGRCETVHWGSDWSRSIPWVVIGCRSMYYWVADNSSALITTLFAHECPQKINSTDSQSPCISDFSLLHTILSSLILVSIFFLSSSEKMHAIFGTRSLKIWQWAMILLWSIGIVVCLCFGPISWDSKILRIWEYILECWSPEGLWGTKIYHVQSQARLYHIIFYKWAH